MNRYDHDFIVECPNNGAKIGYHLTIETHDRILVEDIVQKCNVDVGFHEDLAEAFLRWFGGKQTLVAHHHGVRITTTRGDT